MNNDLISREDLKKAIETWDKFACLPNGKLMPFYMLNEPEKDYEPYVHLRDIRNAIYNAPAINFIISPDYVTELQNHNKELIKQLEDMERPTGEWVLQTYERFNSGNELYKYYCNKCGHKEENAYSDSKLPNFCPNCGADMRREQNDN